MNKRIVAVFDFDGTLTTKDTLLEFIKFSKGNLKFYMGFLLFLPYLILMKLHLYPNWKCKEKIFSHFYKGMSYAQFKKVGIDFTEKVKQIQRRSTLDILKKHLAAGATIYVISASIDEWVRPFCKQLGVKDILATKIEIDSNGIITGKFISRNCYGIEKVNRLLEIEPNRTEYILYAYGDSRGDKEMIEFSDKGTLV